MGAAGAERQCRGWDQRILNVESRFEDPRCGFWSVLTEAATEEEHTSYMLRVLQSAEVSKSPLVRCFSF